MLSGLNMPGLNTTLSYMLWHQSHKTDTGEYFLRGHFPLRIIKYHQTECNNPFVAVFRECSVLIFVKYDLKIPSKALHVGSRSVSNRQIDNVVGHYMLHRCVTMLAKLTRFFSILDKCTCVQHAAASKNYFMTKYIRSYCMFWLASSLSSATCSAR